MVITEEEEDVIKLSSLSLHSEPNSMVSATVGRVMSTLLGSRPKKLQNAISNLNSAPEIASLEESLEQSLLFLNKFIKEAAEKKDPLDEVLIPMIEHSLETKESKHSNQAMILLNWLFQDELIFQMLATDFAGIVSRKYDHYVILGWCILACCLIEYDVVLEKLQLNGIREKYNALLKILSSCSTNLLSVVCSGSSFQGEYELPTRLSVAASDFILSYSVALAKTGLVYEISDKRPKPIKCSLRNLPMSLSPATVDEKKGKSTSWLAKHPNDIEMKLLLWEHLHEVIILVQRLVAWNRKSRSLHARGAERVLKWLEQMRQNYIFFQNGEGLHIKTEAMLLASCWKHYGKLLRLEYYKFSQQSKELLDQYLSGIQFYSSNCNDKLTKNKDDGTETVKFFLNCLHLLLGRFNMKQFEIMTTEYGQKLSQVLISQLHCADEDVVGGAVFILKAVIFRSVNPHQRSSLIDAKEMNTTCLLLLSFLDERDAAAKAVSALVAEYCIISSDGQCIKKVLERLASENIVKRMNAMDVISELLTIVQDSGTSLEQSMSQDLAKHLLECLGDEDSEIQSQASKLIVRIDPSIVLPALVGFMCSPDEKMQSCASETLMEMLKYHNQKCEFICMLIDCLSNLTQNLHISKDADYGREAVRKLETDRVLKLIPEWSKNVENWNSMVVPLIDKLFLEPSNTTIVKFLSCISEYLSESANVVLSRLLMHTRQQKVDESFSKRESGTYSKDNDVKLRHSLFLRLCPLLIIRLLPLRIFDDLHSFLVYGKLLDQCNIRGNGYFDIDDSDCVAALLLNRALSSLEFEDVQKLAAELCGRIHPHVLFPIASFQLEHAINAEDLLKIKACLFSICTSLLVRGWKSVLHPDILKIRKAIETVLLWPSTGADEVSKAQHGCIDCLALMICAELEVPTSSEESTFYTASILTTVDVSAGYSRNSILTFVMHKLTQDGHNIDSSNLDGEVCTKQAIVPLSFRLCMANVLISASQKMSHSGKKSFARIMLPRIFCSVEVMNEPEIKAACVQVLFSTVYHLKSLVLPYASDLLKVSITSLKEDSQKERMAGAKLLASLMASEEAILESISEGLLEGRSLLSSLSMSDPSPEIQQICKRLLMCMISS